MRLSDAIALGRVLMPKMKRGTLEGCALGMGLLAVGRSTFSECAYDGENYVGLLQEWPWLSAELSSMDDRYKTTMPFFLGGMFDEDVMNNKSMTLDQFIDYVRSIEPNEDVVEATSTTRKGSANEGDKCQKQTRKL